MTRRDCLIELGTEELPPKALKGLSSAFADGIGDGLRHKNLTFAGIKAYATPRRLAVIIEQLEQQAPDTEQEIHGPPPAAARDNGGQWSKAVIGFAKKNDVTPEDLIELETKKGPRLGLRQQIKGETVNSCLTEIIQHSLAALPIPKRMRWGSSRTEFIRPAHWLLVLFGNEVIPMTVLNLESGNTTFGHRFHHPEALEVKDPAEYETLLRQNKVIAGFAERRALIAEQVTATANQLNGKAVIDDDLLDEVTALVEWPVALAGSFDTEFLAVPSEALISSMKEHQKYFHVLNEQGQLLPHFITIANIESADAAQVIAGNERVIRPRLSDAAFFFETDQQTPLINRVEKLKTVVFQQQLGTLFDKTQRISNLANGIAGRLNANAEQAARAGLLCKADLVSDMVLEFDKMQGIAGAYYALSDGEDQVVSEAIEQHYWPKFSGDRLPQTAVAQTVAIADRLDTLTGIFGIGQPPTGSKDPFALRRASLTVLRILVEKSLPLDLAVLLKDAAALHQGIAADTVTTVLDYMIERFRAWYEDQQIPVQVFQAVSARDVTVPLDFDLRVKAVHEFTQHAHSTALAEANKRVANILAKQVNDKLPPLNESQLTEAAEIELAKTIAAVRTECTPLLDNQQYSKALVRMADLQQPIDRFFTDVMVMVDDKAVRTNRLALLQQLRDLFLTTADISLLAIG